MENIPSTVVLHKHVDGEDTRFATMAGPLTNNPLGKLLGVIRRGTCQAASEYSRWAYEPVSYLWTDIEPDSDSINYGSCDELSKYQENSDNRLYEELLLVPRRNPRRIIRGDQRALSQIKIDI